MPRVLVLMSIDAMCVAGALLLRHPIWRTYAVHCVRARAAAARAAKARNVEGGVVLATLSGSRGGRVLTGGVASLGVDARAQPLTCATYTRAQLFIRNALRYEHVWVVENDVYFSGNIANFFHFHRQVKGLIFGWKSLFPSPPPPGPCGHVIMRPCDL